ncbi:MAG: protein kinase domain-containing protein [Planctomycetota bacterium]|jgi:tetratricopeptide (TPR) repeat protein
MSLRQSEKSSDRLVEAQGVLEDYLERRDNGEQPDRKQIIADHPHLAPELAEAFRRLQLVEAAKHQAESSRAADHARMALDAPPGPSPDSFPGYELVRRVHQGGQGVVYQAIQQSTQREVAIKVMREGPFADSRDRVRFEREISILGSLKHPHIVAIHDSGLADSHHYFVMDYIPGQPLDVYVASDGRSVDDVLRLFEKVSDAVNAAHLRGIIHRDLKPSNIRIDEEGEPHVLDFGLAKISRHGTGDSAELTMTATGQFVGSLPWASPEQVEGRPDRIDLRTDVYSLGVVLYQMLTGRFPYSVAENIRDAMDSIARAEPIKPASIRRGINDEVETIVLKCLDKDPERRYQTAGELARDIRRYLAGEPIEAKRDSKWYVFQKTLRRHKLPVAVVVGFIMLVACFSIGMTIMYGRASREAERNSRLAACLEDLFQFDPSQVYDGRVSLRAHLEQHADRVVGELDDEPNAQAELMETVAETYRNLGLDDHALEWQGRAAALRFNAPDVDHRGVAMCLARQAQLLHVAGRCDEAIRTYDVALEQLRQATSEADADTVLVLGMYARTLQNIGRYDAARGLFERRLRMARALAKGDNSPVASALLDLGGFMHDTGDYDGAQVLYQRALDMMRRLTSSDDPILAGATELLGLLYKDIGDYAAAEPPIRQAIEMRQRLYGEESAQVAMSHGSLAKLYADAGDWEAAESACRRAYDLQVRFNGPDHRNTARSMTLLGRILVGQERYAEAEPLLRNALEIRRKRKPPAHWKTAKTESILGAVLTGLNRFDEAKPLLLNAYPMIARDRGPHHRRTQEAIKRVVALYEAWGEPDKTAEWRAKLREVNDEAEPAEESKQ